MTAVFFAFMFFLSIVVHLLDKRNYRRRFKILEEEYLRLKLRRVS